MAKLVADLRALKDGLDEGLLTSEEYEVERGRRRSICERSERCVAASEASLLMQPAGKILGW